jgi:hypothetical protein
MLMGCSVKMTKLLGSFYSNVHANYLLDWAHQLMYVHVQLLIIISSSGMLALVWVLDHQSFGRSIGVMMALQ